MVLETVPKEVQRPVEVAPLKVAAAEAHFAVVHYNSAVERKGEQGGVLAGLPEASSEVLAEQAFALVASEHSDCWEAAQMVRRYTVKVHGE